MGFVLDMTWFGYGAGVVMAGWFAGMVVASVFSAGRHI